MPIKRLLNSAEDAQEAVKSFLHSEEFGAQELPKLLQSVLVLYTTQRGSMGSGEIREITIKLTTLGRENDQLLHHVQYASLSHLLKCLAFHESVSPVGEPLPDVHKLVTEITDFIHNELRHINLDEKQHTVKLLSNIANNPQMAAACTRYLKQLNDTHHHPLYADAIREGTQSIYDGVPLSGEGVAVGDEDIDDV